MTTKNREVEKIKELEKEIDRLNGIIEVNIALDECGHYDFGMFKSKKTLKVTYSWWNEYLVQRYKFEVLNDELVRKAKKLKSL